MSVVPVHVDLEDWASRDPLDPDRDADVASEREWDSAARERGLIGLAQVLDGCEVPAAIPPSPDDVVGASSARSPPFDCAVVDGTKLEAGVCNMQLISVLRPLCRCSANSRV